MSDRPILQNENMAQTAYVTNAERYMDHIEAERDRLKAALREAISEIGCLVHPELMSDSKWKKHKLWIDNLKTALQEDKDDQ